MHYPRNLFLFSTSLAVACLGEVVFNQIHLYILYRSLSITARGQSPRILRLMAVEIPTVILKMFDVHGDGRLFYDPCRKVLQEAARTCKKLVVLQRCLVYFWMAESLRNPCREVMQESASTCYSSSCMISIYLQVILQNLQESCSLPKMFGVHRQCVL